MIKNIGSPRDHQALKFESYNSGTIESNTAGTPAVIKQTQAKLELLLI